MFGYEYLYTDRIFAHGLLPASFSPKRAGEAPSAAQLSPRVGIVYQPIEPISLYASYSTSFVPNNNSSTASKEALEPTADNEILLPSAVQENRIPTGVLAQDFSPPLIMLEQLV